MSKSINNTRVQKNGLVDITKSTTTQDTMIGNVA